MFCLFSKLVSQSMLMKTKRTVNNDLLFLFKIYKITKLQLKNNGKIRGLNNFDFKMNKKRL